MAILNIPNSLQNMFAQEILDAIDGGSGFGRINFYSGPMPGNANDAITTQTLLAQALFSKPSFGIVNGLMTANSIAQVLGIATGTCVWARITDSNNNTVMDVDVAQSGATLTITTTSIASNTPIQVQTFYIQVPA